MVWVIVSVCQQVRERLGNEIKKKVLPAPLSIVKCTFLQDPPFVMSQRALLRLSIQEAVNRGAQ